MKKILLIVLILSICGCSTGPMYIALSESDSIKSSYGNKPMQALYNKNAAFFKQVYLRFHQNKIGVYPGGIGLTTLTDQNQQTLHYIMVYIRPSDVKFDGNSTKPETRFSQVLQTSFPKYLQYIRSSDLDLNDIEGLAFGIYWPVLDYSQCDTYGGFIEYIHVYFKKSDIQDILEGRRGFIESLDDTEIITSLNLQPAKSVRAVF